MEGGVPKKNNKPEKKQVEKLLEHGRTRERLRDLREEFGMVLF